MSEGVKDVEDVLIRYATAIDTRDWALFRTCFVADAVCDYGRLGSWTDVEQITTYMAHAHESYVPTAHLLSNFVVDLAGVRAHSRCYVHAVLTRLDEPAAWLDIVGYYDDDLVLTTNGWQISRRTSSITRLMSSP